MADGEQEADGEANEEVRARESRERTEEELEAIREEVEERYDFDSFTEADMLEMSPEEWEAAFDPDTWITGTELLDRVEADLRNRVARRTVFAVIERVSHEGVECLLAYSDAGYALVYPDGSVEGEGTVLRDTKPVVALCSMAEYEVPDPPADASLPDPDEVSGGSSNLGDRVMQAVAGVQVLTGLFVIAAPFLFDLGGQGAGLIATVVGAGFLLIGVLLFVVVANARLSDRFRAREYEDRLRAAGVGSEERPEFLPVEGEEEEANA